MSPEETVAVSPPPARAAFSTTGWRSFWPAAGAGFLIGASVACLASVASTKWAVCLTLGVGGAVLLPMASFALGGPPRLLLVLFGLSLPLELDWFLLYLPFGYESGVNGVGVNPVLLVSFATASYWLWRRSQDANVQRGAARRLRWPAAAFLLTSVISAIHTVNMHQWVFGVVLNTSMVMVAVAACQMIAGGRTRDLRLFWLVLLFALLLESTFVILQACLGFSFTLKGDILYRGASTATGSVQRYTGTFGVPSVTGTFLATMLLLTMPALFVKELRISPPLAAPAFAAGLVALALTLTRSAWIAFAGGAVALGYHLYQKRKLRKGVLLGCMVAAVAAVLVAWPLLSQRLGADYEGDFFARWDLILIAMQMIKANPVLGVGVNTASLVVRDYVPGDLGNIWVFVPHNQFLLMACEAGIPGLVSLIWLFVAGFRASAAASRSEDPMIREFARALTVVLGVLAFSLNLDFVQGSQTYPLVFLMIGLAVGLERLSQRAAGLREPESCKKATKSPPESVPRLGHGADRRP